jgi:hypothetical protein
MMTLVARIQEVLHGHSDRAQIRAVDARGHELKLEVPVEAARGLTAEHVLVLDWSAHLVPASATAEQDQGAPATAPAEAAAATPTPDAGPAGPSPAARQLASLIGLKLE